MHPTQKIPSRMRSNPHPALVFAVIFIVIFLLHAPLLQLPYFWDEAGYYVPAARDLLLTGSLIPHTTVSNAHPPLVMAWVALWWKLGGFAPLVTRSAMLVIAAFSLLGLFRLAQRVANVEVAVASTVCTALYPVFFAQSSLAQVDLAAAGLTFWGLLSLSRRSALRSCDLVFAGSARQRDGDSCPCGIGRLATGAIHPCARHPSASVACCAALWDPREGRSSLSWRKWACSDFSLPLTAVVRLSLRAHRIRFRQSRILPLQRCLDAQPAANSFWRWFCVSGRPSDTCIFGCSLSRCLVAMFLPPLRDGEVERRTNFDSGAGVFFVVIAAYVVALALIGGAVLARYMLTAVPLGIILAVSTLRRTVSVLDSQRLPASLSLSCWPGSGILLMGSRRKTISPIRDYVRLHEDAERFLEARYPIAHVLLHGRHLTNWRGLGWATSTRPVQVVRIEDFSLEQVLSAADFRSHFEVALVFSTKYEPARPLLDRAKRWTDLKRRFFGYHRDLPPAAAAQILGGHIVFSEERKGQWVAVIELWEKIRKRAK